VKFTFKEQVLVVALVLLTAHRVMVAVVVEQDTVYIYPLFLLRQTQL
jgi:hypothetical protein